MIEVDEKIFIEKFYSIQKFKKKINFLRVFYKFVDYSFIFQFLTNQKLLKNSIGKYFNQKIIL